jgi:hypothetical protein
MMKYVRTAVWSAAAAFIAVSAVQAAPFVTGDVFASLVGMVEQFSSDGTLKDTLGMKTSRRAVCLRSVRRCEAR